MSNNTNKTIRVFIPFLKAAMQVLQELTQEVFIKKNVYTHVGNLPGAEYKVEIGLIGDIRSRVIFDFNKEFAQELTKIMLGVGDEVDSETIEGAITEIGNMVSGTAMGLLEEIGISCDITPPKLYIGRNKVVSDQAQLGVLEFTSKIGGFSVSIVTNESNQFIKNDAILSVGFTVNKDILLSRFFYPKGLYLITCSPQKIKEAIKKYHPALILLNMREISSQDLSYINELTDIGETHLATFGEASITAPFASVIPKEPIPNKYALLEEVKSLLDIIELSIFDNRADIVIDVPVEENTTAYFCVKTRRGDLESIPILTLSFSRLTLNIENHQYINFPERKNLVAKNDPKIQMGDKESSIVKAQIGKHIDDNQINIIIHNIMETEMNNITEYMNRVLTIK